MEPRELTNTEATCQRLDTVMYQLGNIAEDCESTIPMSNIDMAIMYLRLAKRQIREGKE